jgi:fatty acid desaturase
MATHNGRTHGVESDPRLRTIAWKDLLALTRREVASELLLSLPWLVASLVFADSGVVPAALACSFMFFLTGLRQVHNAHHYALGLSKRATEWVMFALSVFMLGSMHAVQVNHLRHHRFCMGPDDVEAMSAHMPWWKALLTGPGFTVRTHHAALRNGGPVSRRWIRAELVANVVVIVLCLFVLDVAALRYHVLVMMLGQSFSAFFAVWSVHHGCDPAGVHSRTSRNRFIATAAYGMFYHLEHHLFPAVPTAHLAELARRIDAVAGDVVEHDVLPWSTLYSPRIVATTRRAPPLLRCSHR